MERKSAPIRLVVPGGDDVVRSELCIGSGSAHHDNAGFHGRIGGSEGQRRDRNVIAVLADFGKGDGYTNVSAMIWATADILTGGIEIFGTGVKGLSVVEVSGTARRLLNCDGGRGQTTVVLNNMEGGSSRSIRIARSDIVACPGTSRDVMNTIEALVRTVRIAAKR